MELRQLKYFLAVAEELHFGRAAQKMNVSQPPLSQQIKLLEEELNTRLFMRTSRSVSLTQEGQYFMKEAKCILNRLQLASDTVKAMARGEEGLLSIGFVVVASQTQLPETIREFRLHNPKVRLELKELSTNEQLEGFANGDLDMGFIRYYGQNLKGLNTMSYHKENYALAI